MSIASKLLQVNQVKQDIKEAIETKGVPMTDVAFTEYANKILDISMTYEDYARTLYLAWGKSNQFEAAWESSLTVDPLEISEDGNIFTYRGIPQYPNGETEGVIIPQGVTSIGSYAFAEWTANNQPLVIPESVTSIKDYAFYKWSSNNHPLVIPDSVTSIGNSAFSNWEANTHPLVIPDSVTSIGNNAFRYWTSNKHQLVIPDSVTSIGTYVFQNWKSNNQPLVISNSVTRIGNWAFGYWEANTHPLVIPDSVTSIGTYVFYDWLLVPYIEIQAITPPTLANINAFGNQNNAPIYVPDESVDDYKAATNWVNLASRIFSINDKE